MSTLRISPRPDRRRRRASLRPAKERVPNGTRIGAWCAERRRDAPAGGNRRGDAAPREAMLVRLEDVLDPHAEERGDTKRERKARVVLFVLERAHGLARDLEFVGELALRPVALRAQHAKPVLHR